MIYDVCRTSTCTVIHIHLNIFKIKCYYLIKIWVKHLKSKYKYQFRLTNTRKQRYRTVCDMDVRMMSISPRQELPLGYDQV